MPTRHEAGLLRQRGRHDSGKVSMVELFFDLVFVFAVTQLSHLLLADLSVAGALRVLMLWMAVWMIWIFTSWVTNWLNPEKVLVRIFLFVQMLAGLVLAVCVPKAFGERGLLFALAFIALQLSRTLFMLWAVRHGPAHRLRNFQRVVVWMAAGSAFWLAGGLAQGEARVAWWITALAIDFTGPWLFFWVPGLGASKSADWDVDGAHMAERCALFVIIALGESLLITGATFSDKSWTTATVGAFVTAFLNAVAMWWIYFHAGAEHAAERIATSSDPGRTARGAYSYLHVLIVAGIIVSAGADEIVLAHPDHADVAAIACLIGGPALFIVAVAAFKWISYERHLPPASHLAGLLMLTALLGGALAHWFSALQLAATVTVVLMLVAVWEAVALREQHATATAHGHGGSVNYAKD
jgi:low temperature requirement protein LtrA